MPAILFAKESECTENPGGHDRRATLLPHDVPDYLDAGFDVTVQTGIGQGLGLLDRQYELAGARVERRPQCNAGKDMVVRLKGPAEPEIAELSPDTILFTMGHLYCFPERERALSARGVRLVGMESIRRQAEPSDAYLAGIRAGASAPTLVKPGRVTVHLHSTAERDYVNGLIRGLMRIGGAAVDVVPLDARARRVESREGASDLVVTRLGTFATAADGGPIDLDEHPTAPEGLAMASAELHRDVRAIGRLRQVGIGGARYGVELHRSLHPGTRPRTLVTGYGNVAMGAFEYLVEKEIPFTVLGRAQTAPSAIPRWLRGADLVINGAEAAHKGKFIISDENAFRDLAAGSVVIDLIGGSPQVRSPVEAFEWTTFLPQIHFERGGRYFAGLWGWDMYHSMYESAHAYSAMVKNVLLGSEKYAESLEYFLADHTEALRLGGPR